MIRPPMPHEIDGRAETGFASADLIDEVEGRETTVCPPPWRNGGRTGLRRLTAPTPSRRFDVAGGQVLAHLAEVAPMGAWTATRVTDGRQVVLAVEDSVFGMEVGAGVEFAASMCSSMLAGHAPQIAPSAAAVPQYAAAAAAGLRVGACMGMPIVQPDGTLFGTVCGMHPTALPVTLLRHQPLLDLLSGLLSTVLRVDMEAVAVARELERSRHQSDTDVLTGLLNRRGWDRFIACEEQRFRRFGDAAGVAVIDLDQLKVINDDARMRRAPHRSGVAFVFRVIGSR